MSIFTSKPICAKLHIKKGNLSVTAGGVQMRLNTKYSIALHCLVFLAEYGDQMKVTSEVLARSTGCNPVIIRNILGALQRENFVTIARGVGGAHLNTDPKKLTVWQVYQAVEPEGLEHFMNLHPHPSGKCPVGRRIAEVLSHPYQQIEEAIQQTMENITLQQLLDCYHDNDDIHFDYEPDKDELES